MEFRRVLFRFRVAVEDLGLSRGLKSACRLGGSREVEQWHEPACANAVNSCTARTPSINCCGATASMALPSAEKSCRERPPAIRSEEHTSELQSLMRISYAVFCLKKKKNKTTKSKK